MAPHSSTLAWKIPWTGEPGGLPSVGSHGVGHDWGDLAAVSFTMYFQGINLLNKYHSQSLNICKYRLPPLPSSFKSSGGPRKIPWRREWLPTPVFLPGKSHGQRSLVGYSPWGRKESDTTEWLHFHFLSINLKKYTIFKNKGKNTQNSWF